MRRGLVVLLAPLMLSAAVVAQTQVNGSVVISDQFGVALKPIAVVAKVSPDEVVSRMLTFDRDRDGKVVQSELAERMHPLMARGDANRDGALDATELRALAVAPPPPPSARQGRIGGPFGGSYGFADEDSFSSRNHIEGAIDDLKLTAETREQALSIAKAYVDRIEADAEADLVKELNGVLSPDQILALQESLKTRSRRVVRFHSPDGTTQQVVIAVSIAIEPHINQFKLTPDKRLLAREAADRYTARVKMNEAERVALVSEMRGILNAEERDDLRAALARRPVVAKGGIAGVLAGQIHLLEQKLTTIGQSEPVRVKAIDETLQTQGR